MNATSIPEPMLGRSATVPSGFAVLAGIVALVLGIMVLAVAGRNAFS